MMWRCRVVWDLLMARCTCAAVLPAYICVGIHCVYYYDCTHVPNCDVFPDLACLPLLRSTHFFPPS